MRITKRRTNQKRHTTAYLVGNRWMPRGKVVRLAERGKVDGVMVVNGPTCKYVRSMPGVASLETLDYIVG